MDYARVPFESNDRTYKVRVEAAIIIISIQGACDIIKQLPSSSLSSKHANVQQMVDDYVLAWIHNDDPYTTTSDEQFIDPLYDNIITNLGKYIRPTTKLYTHIIENVEKLNDLTYGGYRTHSSYDSFW
tara:strand:- start:26739 stop:27122 length:384 start_codon:yes stop_codon:yes gene_type:complete